MLFGRVLTACGTKGVFLATFSLTVELVGVKEKVPFLPWVSWITLLGNLSQASFAVGETIVSIMAMLIRDWSTFQWIVSALTFLQLALWFLIPESPRWLIANNKFDEFTIMIEKAVIRNRTKLSPHLMHKGISEVKNIEDENRVMDM